MLAPCQGGIHRHQAGDPRKRIKAADEASLVLHMRQMQSEQSLCHARERKRSARPAAAGAHVGPHSWPWGLQEATSSSSILKGMHQNTSRMPFLSFQWGEHKGRRNRTRLSLMLHDIPHLLPLGWEGAAWAEPSRWCIPLALQAPVAVEASICLHTAPAPTYVKAMGFLEERCTLLRSYLEGFSSPLERLLKILKWEREHGKPSSSLAQVSHVPEPPCRLMH